MADKKWLVLIVLPIIIYAIACSLNLCVSINEIPTSTYTDNTVEILDSQDAYDNGWNVWQNHGQSYTSVVVGFVVPQLSKLFSISIVDVYRYILPLIYSFTPVILYFLYRKLASSSIAFMGALFFATLPPSYQEVTTRGKSEVAEPFAALTLLLIFSDIRARYKIPLTIATAVLAIWSHYSIGIILLVWIFAMLILSKQRLNLVIIGGVSLIFFFIYYSYASGGEFLNQLFHWNNLTYHEDPIRSLLLASDNVTIVSPVSNNSVIISSTSTMLWIIRIIIYTMIALMVSGFMYLVIHREWLKKYPEYLSLIAISTIIIICVLSVQFFTKGLYISAWIQYSAFSAGLLYGLSTKYVHKWIPYALMIVLLVASITKY